MTDDHEFDDTTGKNRVCASCVGDPFLKQKIVLEAGSAACDYCVAGERSISISTFADWVQIAFDHHFTRTDSEPTDWDVASRFEWEREGTLVAQVIEDEAVVSSEIAEDTRTVLHGRHFDIDGDRMGEEAEFDSDAHYRPAELDTDRFQQMWGVFKKSILTKSRFFNFSAEGILAEIFSGIERNSPAIIEAGPGTHLPAIYRARVCETGKEVSEVLEAPELQLGARRPGNCPPGRMNPYGIPMFYGAKKAKTTLNEVRPPVGSSVVVGRFEFIRHLRLLDLGRMERLEAIAAHSGSVFDSEHKRRLERLAFLKTISHEFSSPVMPSQVLESYLPTQAVADFLAGREPLSLDGIIFSSSQSRGLEDNVVLFTEASRVQPSKYGKSAKRQFHAKREYPDGGEVDAYVSVELDGEVQNDSLELQGCLSSELDADRRSPALKLDLDSLEIYEVRAVDIDAPSHRVYWQENNPPVSSGTASLDDLN